ncbi:HEAT repeat domain-containing protein [Nostoc sp. NIES-2111]
MKLSLALLLAGCLCAADEKAYQQALSHIDSREYREALAKLKAEVEANTNRADAALYWSAYAQNKLGDRNAALAALEALQSRYASSRWMSDARALQLEIKQASGQPVSPEAQADEDLKLMAIQGLMNADPERSIPLLEKLLNDPAKSAKLKEKALFVLTQTGSPKAMELTASIAKGNTNPELRKSAIRNLGIGGKKNGALLEDIYKNAPDATVKKDILQSFMIMGDRPRLLALAKSEKDEKLRGSAIHWLGVSGGRDELAQLYASESTPALKKDILHGLMLAGARDQLFQLAKGEKDESLRGSAIHWLGVSGGKDQLAQLYATESSPKVKKDILHGLFVGGGARQIIEVARAEKDPELKREAVKRLSLMNSKEASDFMLELLK